MSHPPEWAAPAAPAKTNPDQPYSMTDNTPLVSIALATYNGEAFLEEQLASLHAQSYPNLEIVACDDCSRDGTVEILRKWQASHGLHVHLNPQNLGFVRNFEQCLRMCRGEYILLADQDDVWEPHKVATLLEKIRSSEALLVYSDAQLIDEQGEPLPCGLWETLERQPVAQNARTAFYLGNVVTGCTTIMRRELLEHTLPIPDGFTFHDWWLGYVAAQHERLDFLPQRLTRYRQHDGNVAGAGLKAKRSRRTWKSPLSIWNEKRRKLQKLDNFAKDHARNLQIFHRYESEHGLDNTVSAMLLRWGRDYDSKYSLHDYREFFQQNPQLFATMSNPRKSMRRSLKSKIRRKLKVLMTPLIAVTVALVCAAIWLF
ncbi:glycosyltransferase family 2 protein [Pseudomonas sp. N040]|uniref:glycosyltransferase family 2 protein n=1 Tax=Pseudomonas sp. N040 TaxID=2785325 RepID=UPI0018A25744|nr:glycosyltransferase family 2 protein [Pseudomonas sp. N040]MBF7731741.1 glycosyltransferase family 2 protein [Pseudomonas sp. N040]MBW7015385.1 glycosyltransferase family 2 protein [Pseudomonas sp. N040]